MAYLDVHPDATEKQINENTKERHMAVLGMAFVLAIGAAIGAADVLADDDYCSDNPCSSYCGGPCSIVEKIDVPKPVIV